MTKKAKKAAETEVSPAVVDSIVVGATQTGSTQFTGSYSPHMVLLYSCGKCFQRFATGEVCPNCGAQSRTHVKTIDACALIDRILRISASEIVYDVETLRKEMYR